MKKYLIVNADDFNTNLPRSRGILEAARQGIVTSTTVLTNLPLEQALAEELRAVFGRAVGVHLNLTKGRPLTDDAHSLVDERGVFLDKPRAWKRALMGGYDLRQVEREFRAQIGRLRDLGIEPSHLDGNNHIHVFPGLAALVAELCRSLGIRCVRLPIERCGASAFRVDARRWLVGTLAWRAQKHFSEAGLLRPERFAGISFPAAGSLEQLLALIGGLPGGVTELMCHPGYSDAASGPFSNPQREQELIALTHSRVWQRVQECGVQLVSFSDLPLDPRA